MPFTIDLSNGIPVWAAYGVNMNLMPVGAGGFSGLAMAALTAPADTVYLADAAKLAYNPLGKLLRTNQIVPPSDDGPAIHGRHNGVANVLWMDAHVKAVKPVIPTVQYGPWSLDMYKNNNLGDLVAPGSVSTNPDYYFLISK